VRTYADSSFILRLVLAEATSPQAIAGFRRLGKPAVFFLSLHSLEVRNGIVQRELYQRRSASSIERRGAERERATAEGLLEILLNRRTLIDATVDWEQVFNRAIALSVKHGKRAGARAIDLMHVASALELECEQFLTVDDGQAEIAKAEGFAVPILS